MSNPFDDMRTAVANAQFTIQAADNASKDMAHLLKGRLRHVPPYILQDLKRELSEFNAKKGEWKS